MIDTDQGQKPDVTMSVLDFTCHDERATMKLTIDPAKAASYRLHAKRWGTERIARKMARDGYHISVALEVLAGTGARSY